MLYMKPLELMVSKVKCTNKEKWMDFVNDTSYGMDAKKKFQSKLSK